MQHHPDGYRIKLADFGLSQENRIFLTLYGTDRYLAPEIYREEEWRQHGGESRSYTPAVDIWSLGVVVFECHSRLPRSRTEGIAWCRIIIQWMKRSTVMRLNKFLQSSMVVLDFRNRKSRGNAIKRLRSYSRA